MPKIGVCVIFNHAFEGNIPKLRKIYHNRFSEVIYLMPSLRSPETDIKTVYRGSYNFHGYIADRVEDLLRMNVDYYLFIHDDVVLNPSIDQSSLVQKIGLGEKDAFIPYIREFNPTKNWYWNERVISRLLGIEKQLLSSGFMDFLKYLPEKEYAIAQFEKHKIPAITSIDFSKSEAKNLLKSGKKLNFWRSLINKFYHKKNNGNEINNFIWQELWSDRSKESQLSQLPYPLAFAVSDTFVIRRSCLEDFAHICGIFAAMDIFVEVAIPTALLLSCSEVQLIKNTQLKAHTNLKPWSINKEETKKLNEIIKSIEKIDDLHKAFVDDNILSIHPVKLSKLI